MKYGVIDIGSNSVRLLFDGKKYVMTTMLAQKQTAGGELSKLGMGGTLNAVYKLINLVVDQGGDYRVFATEAVRSAANKDYFLSLLRNRNITVDVLSPEEEAAIGFAGAYDGTGKKVAVLDVGGASSELIVGDDKGIIYSHSLPLGSVRCSDTGLMAPELNVMVAEKIKEYGEVPHFEKLILIGGTASSLVAVREKIALDPYDGSYDNSKVHGQVIARAEIIKIVDEINAVPEQERIFIPGLHRKKIFSVPAGGVLIAEIMKYLGAEEGMVSERDNLEGYMELVERGEK